MGKTRLVNHIFKSFNSNDYRRVLLSMKIFDTKDKADTGRLLYCFCQEISNQLNLPNQVKGHWEREEDVVNILKCTSYFENYLFPHAKSPIVLVIDDLNSLTSYDSTCKDFCSMLRAFYDKCAPSSDQYHENWGRLKLIIAHSRDPKLPDYQSPFNVGEVIELPEFTVDQVRSLAEQHKIEMNPKIVSRIMELVGGHPYLIKLSLEHLKNINLNSQEDINNFINQSSTQIGIYSDHLNKLLRKVKDNQLELERGLYKVVSSPNPVFISSLIADELDGLGLIKYVYVSQEKLTLTCPSCELYRIFFKNTIERS